MSAEHGFFVKLEPGVTGQQIEGIQDAIGLLRGVEEVTKVDGERPLIAELGSAPMLTSAQFLQAWHNLSPNQKNRLFGEIKRELLSGSYNFMDKKDLSVPETAIAIGVSQERVKVLIREGRLPHTKDTRGWYHIPTDAVISYKALPPGRPPRNQ